MDNNTAQSIINKTRQDYDTIAEHFSNTRFKEWSEFNEFLKYLKPNANVLDLGCGNGRLLHFLKGQKITYTGLDISPKLINFAYKLAKPDNLPPYRFLRSDFTRIPFGNQEFDVVFAIASIYHIPSKGLRLAVVSEISRVLKRDGIFIMTYWNMWHPQRIKLVLRNILKKIVGKSKYDFYDAERPWKNSKGETMVRRYCHAFTLREVKKLLWASGFRILEKYYSQKEKRVKFWNGFNGVIIAQRL